MVKNLFRKTVFTALLLVGGFLFALPNNALAAEDVVIKNEPVVASVSPAVVSITVRKPIQKVLVTYREYPELGIVEGPIYELLGGPDTEVIGAGTGFMVDSNGYIITNSHVLLDVVNAIYMIGLSSGNSYQAKVVFQDKENDIAVLKIEGTKYPVLALGDSDGLQLGEQIIAIGNALGKSINIAVEGTISQLNRTIVIENRDGSEKTLKNLIQTDARVKRGYSGSPLFNLNGEVVGIIVAVADGTSHPISFALPINPIKEIVEKVLGR